MPPQAPAAPASARPPPAAATAASASAATPVAPRPSGPAAFAVSSRVLRTRAEAEQVRDAMQGLLRSSGNASVQVEALAQGDDWLVIGWPFGQRSLAEKARSVLVSRGMRVEVVDS